MLAPLAHTSICSRVEDQLYCVAVTMSRRYLGGSGESLTVWISTAASIVLIFYGYDQVSAQNFVPLPNITRKCRAFLAMSL